jgi:hypothetical protein
MFDPKRFITAVPLYELAAATTLITPKPEVKARFVTDAADTIDACPA